MASTAEMVQGWLNSGGSANSPEKAAGAASSPPARPVGGESRTDNEGESVASQESVTEGLFDAADVGDGEDTPSDSTATGEAKPEGKQETSAKEVITVTDESGRRKKVEIDYSDRGAIKKAFELGAGARKWQAERDSARNELTQVRGQIQELQNTWNTLESAHKQNGVEGIFDLLEGQRGAYKSWEKKVVDRARFMENASPEEVQAFQAKEAADRDRREASQIRKEMEELRKQVTSEKEEASFHSLESQVHPVFDKYRFADKLGDSNDEHMFDEMLWNSALKRLEPYESKGLPITNELIEREFRLVASAIRKRIGVQAEKRASKVIDQKKQEATENAQAQVRNGYKAGAGGAAKEARELINSGNLTGLLSNWGKYGKLFNK